MDISIFSFTTLEQSQHCFLTMLSNCINVLGQRMELLFSQLNVIKNIGQKRAYHEVHKRVLERQHAFTVR